MDKIFEFLHLAERLKYEKCDNKLSNGEHENVAAHTWMMGLFALLFHDKMEESVDIGHVLKIILVHDLAEAITGDMGLAIQQNDGAVESKRAREEAGIKKMLEILPGEKRDEILTLWLEYEDMATAEGRFAKACDKLEAHAQALFFGSVKYWEDYGDPDFYYDDLVNSRREKYWKREPALNEFYEFIRDAGMKQMKSEGVDAEKYLPKGKNE